MGGWSDSKQRVEVLGRKMAYVEQGEGAPIVLLHGNPTSSYLWRSVLPELAGLGRVIVPDLIGMGDSDKLEAEEADRYTFVCHRRYLDALLDQFDLGEDITFVIHDWGSALGFDWARRNPGRVRGIAYMEAIVAPIPDWSDWPESVRPVFQGFRSPAGEEMVLDQNVFVEGVLPGAIMRTLEPEEMDEYRRPFAAAGDDRLPTLTWPRQIPIGGEPADVHEIVAAYAEWLPKAPGIPKLFVNAEPGAILRGAAREFCRTWPDQQEVTVPGLHFVQEDSGPEIGRAIASWLGSLA
ncbi:MAG: haloalkane dehalogenase [Thermoleophilaceae bacterium]|nr:haloalkane dehalogenase [Thermoleophilaceae bacterium]